MTTPVSVTSLGKVDTGLCGFCLCLLWGDVADGGVDPCTIVIVFDISEQFTPRGIAIGVFAVVDQLGFPDLIGPVPIPASASHPALRFHCASCGASRGRCPARCDPAQRPTAAHQQGYRFPLELIRKMTPSLAHSTPFRSRRSLAKVSTNSREPQLPNTSGWCSDS